MLQRLVAATTLAMAASVAASGPLSPVRVQDGGGPVEVDVALVLAVDVSRSMDPGEQILQRNGYINSVRLL